MYEYASEIFKRIKKGNSEISEFGSKTTNKYHVLILHIHKGICRNLKTYPYSQVFLRRRLYPQPEIRYKLCVFFNAYLGKILKIMDLLIAYGYFQFCI